MAGHSKWAQIKRKKAVLDAKRGKLFSRLIREISVAARLGGGDPNGNPRLRQAIERARAASMPNENIQRAIERATGGGEGAAFEDVLYEGYGPGGVAILVRATTDNRNRTTAEVRHIFTKHGGTLGETGCVAYLFEETGLVLVEGAREADVFEAAVEAGADDIEEAEGTVSIRTAPEHLARVAEALRARGFSVAEATVTRLPMATVSPPPEEARKAARLVAALEEHDDVAEVATNLDAELLETAA